MKYTGRWWCAGQSGGAPGGPVDRLITGVALAYGSNPGPIHPVRTALEITLKR